MNPHETVGEAELEPVEVLHGELVDDTDHAAVTPARPTETPLSTAAAQMIARAPATNTVINYGVQWAKYTDWCQREGLPPLPCDSNQLANYATAMAGMGKAPSTIELAISAIRRKHRDAGLPPPDTDRAQKVLTAHKRDWADAGKTVKQARVLRPRELRAVLKACDDASTTTMAARDRAFLLLSVRTGRRFSEIAGLNLTDVRLDTEGLLYFVRRTKTDQTGQRARWQRLVPHRDQALCVVTATRQWLALLAERGITEGPLIRRVDRKGRVEGEEIIEGVPPKTGRLSTPGAIKLWQRALLRAGIDPTGVSTHTARRSAMTNGHRAGKDLVQLTDRLGYVRGSSVALGYIAAADDEDTDPLDGIL
jgi:integrase